MQSYETTEEKLMGEWDALFYKVDHDNNNVLDLDEFIEAIAQIPDLSLQPYLARQAFIEATADMSVEVLDIASFRKVRPWTVIIAGHILSYARQHDRLIL